MANYPGWLLPQTQLQLLARGQTGTLLGNVYPRPTRGQGIDAFGSAVYESVEHPWHAPSTFNFPWGVNPSRRLGVAAVLLATYADDLFNHFLLIPSGLSLGNLLTNETHVIEIANLFFVNKSLASVANNAGLGIGFTGVPSLPATISPFGSITIDVTVSTTGPPTINGDLVLVGTDVGAGNPQTLSIPVTGKRITLFPYDPEQEYTEELNWKTQIFESFAGEEQRVKIRQNPRQVLTYTPFATDPVDNLAIRLLLFNWLPRVWGVPLWWEQTGLTTSAAIGDTVVNCDTTSADYRVGGLVFLRNAFKLFEAFEIVSMTATSLTLNSNLVNAYPIRGSQIMPARTAYAKTQTTAKTYLPGQSKFSIEFTTLDNVNLAAWNQAQWPSYLGFPVLNDINYVDSTLSEGTDRNGVIVIDNFAGTIYQVVSTDRSRPKTVKTWWTNTRQDIWPIRQLMHYLGGSQGVFWLPTNRNDLIVASEIDPGIAALTVDNVGYSIYGVDNTGTPMIPFANIRITLTNGAVLYKAITGATSGFGSVTETLALDSAVSSTLIPMAQVQRVDFMQLMRISDDRVKLTHDHPGRSKIEINCVGVRQ